MLPFTELHCEKPPEIEFAKYDSSATVYGSIIGYSCAGGYHHVGKTDFVIKCLASGEWSDHPSTCQRECSDLITAIMSIILEI